MTTTKDCDLAYLSYARKFLIEEMKSSTVVYSMKDGSLCRESLKLISSSNLLGFSLRRKVTDVLEVRRQLTQTGVGGALSHVMR